MAHDGQSQKCELTNFDNMSEIEKHEFNERMHLQEIQKKREQQVLDRIRKIWTDMNVMK